jgi:hypothetical protein
MKVVIAGSRTISADIQAHYDFLQSMIDIFEKEHGKITVVVSGKARGVDRLGEKWAKNNKVGVALFPADWDNHKKAAGIIRNEEMGNFADGAVIMWDGVSRGTVHMSKVMRHLGKPYIFKVCKPVIINEYKQQPSGIIKVRSSDGQEWFAPNSRP